jgi:MOSC domain-containing protein YiiM
MVQSRGSPNVHDMAQVVSVNVGAVRTVEWYGRTVTTGIWKFPVEGRTAVRGVNLDGDAQADLRVHGGPDKAVYAYAAEDYEWWAGQLGRPLEHGTFGENLTTTGIDLNSLVIGTRCTVGSTLLEVAQPRLPCFKLGMRMGDAEFVDRFEAAARFGAYLRIVQEGDVGAGDEIAVVEERTDGIRIDELGRAMRDRDEGFLRRVAGDADVPESWRDWAQRALARAG